MSLSEAGIHSPPHAGWAVGKGHAGKGCPTWEQGHFISIPPQGDSMLGKQLQQEAQGLRNFYQEKVLPQQRLVVSLEAQ